MAAQSLNGSNANAMMPLVFEEGSFAGECDGGDEANEKLFRI